MPGPPGGGAGPTRGGSTTGQAVAKPGHVFVINLENKGYNEVWGADSRATYLSQTLRSRGVLLSEYYGIAHNSQPELPCPNLRTGIQRHDPERLPHVRRIPATGTAPLGQVEGTGCVYRIRSPRSPGSCSAAGKTWKAYMEDMGTPCRHPKLGAKDSSQGAKVGDEYATRHNPFVYFESITSSPDCQSNVVDYAELAGDLRSVETTPNLSYISPNLCNDGHDNPCVDGSPGGLAAADGWLSRQIPAILDSPAFKQDGMLVITFDEAEGKTVGPSDLVPGGTAGGRIGALVTLAIHPWRHDGGPALQPLQPPGQHRRRVLPPAPRVRGRTRPGQLRPGRLQRPPLTTRDGLHHGTP